MGSKTLTDTMTVEEHKESILEVLSMINPGVRSLMRNNIKDALKDVCAENRNANLSAEARTILAKQVVYAGQALDLLDEADEEVRNLEKPTGAGTTHD